MYFMGFGDFNEFIIYLYFVITDLNLIMYYYSFINVITIILLIILLQYYFYLLLSILLILYYQKDYLLFGIYFCYLYLFVINQMML